MGLCRVCMISSLPVFLPVLRALLCLCLLLYSELTFYYLSSFPANSKQVFGRCSWYTHDPAQMSTLLSYLHVYFSNSCVCVSEPVYAFPSASIFVHIYHHFHVCFLWRALYLYPCFCAFLLFLKLNRHLYYGVYSCNHTLTHILILWFRLYFNFVICTSIMSKSNIKFIETWLKIKLNCNNNPHNNYAQHK